jgi:2-oxoglutarate ferredoxin oxidoreductase subunit beta
MGVFRAVTKPSYDELIEDQTKAIIEKSGAGNLEKLLNSGDTWTVSPQIAGGQS